MDQVGYARVSTREERQVFDRQIDALRAAGCHRIFDERGNRSDPLRPYRKFPHGCCQRAMFKVLHGLDQIGNLSGPNYEYGEAEVDRIISALRASVDEVEHRLRRKKPEKSEFTFD